MFTVATKLKVLMSTKGAYNSFSNQFGNTWLQETSITRAIWNNYMFFSGCLCFVLKQAPTFLGSLEF